MKKSYSSPEIEVTELYCVEMLTTSDPFLTGEPDEEEAF